MKIKKAGKHIIGANLTVAEQKAIDIEIQKKMAEYDEKNTREIDSMILWVLHTEFGFGHSRLKRFHNRFNKAITELIEHYQMDESDVRWLCTTKLKEYGVDLDEWDKEEKV